jgi:hypothetical protein
VNNDNRENPSESPGGSPDAFRRCVELTKGFDRACPEPVIKTTLDQGWIFVAILFFLLLLFGPSFGDADLPIFFVPALIIELLIIVYFIHIRTVVMLFKDFNKITSLLEPTMFESEKVLLTLMITKESPFGIRLKSVMTGGVLVLTTHRGFLLTIINIRLGSLCKLTQKPYVYLLETFEYSSPIHLLETYDPRNIIDKIYCKRFAIKTDKSDISETWYVLPCEGNNYSLFEAIIQKRDRIK